MLVNDVSLLTLNALCAISDCNSAIEKRLIKIIALLLIKCEKLRRDNLVFYEMGDSDEENYATFGVPLDPLDEGTQIE